MFENHADPIVGGRDTMGYSKIYCDIPRVQHDENKYIATASSWDFRFMKMELDISKPIPDMETFKSNEARSADKMHYKYVIKGYFWFFVPLVGILGKEFF